MVRLGTARLVPVGLGKAGVVWLGVAGKAR